MLCEVKLVATSHVQILIDCSGEEGTEKTPDTAFLNKKLALLKILEEGPVTKTIIFCNKVKLKYSTQKMTVCVALYNGNLVNCR